jgi:predicted nucleotide-binding protein
MTIIEKFEYYARLCSFAFALMTPDDKIVGVKEQGSVWRARPNVILELGWFMARLGRDRVVLFSQGELEIPVRSSGPALHSVQREPNGSCTPVVLSIAGCRTYVAPVP